MCRCSAKNVRLTIPDFLKVGILTYEYVLIKRDRSFTINLNQSILSAMKTGAIHIFTLVIILGFTTLAKGQTQQLITSSNKEQQWIVGASLQYRAANPGTGAEIKLKRTIDLHVEKLQFYAGGNFSYFFFQKVDVTPHGVMDIGITEETRSYDFFVNSGLLYDHGMVTTYAGMGIGFERLYGNRLVRSAFTGSSVEEIDARNILLVPSAGLKINTGWKISPYIETSWPLYIQKKPHEKFSGKINLGLYMTF
ncbi:MAG: hypothetical protein EA390_03120 [Balneolaceae bacterium]|nr:MAG: hypothetical protein EA390_03120 [Balneolaceae bacterium]